MRGHSTVTHSHQRTQTLMAVRNMIEDDYRTKGQVDVDDLANRLFDAGHPSIKGVERDVLVSAYHFMVREEIERWLNDTSAAVDHPNIPPPLDGLMRHIPIAVELPTPEGNSVFRAVGGRIKPLTFGELNNAISHIESEVQRLSRNIGRLRELRHHAHTRGTTINDPVIPDLWRTTIAGSSVPESAAEARAIETRQTSAKDDA